MEDTAQMLQATNLELAQAKETMQSLVNELKASADIIGPSLMEHVKQLRSTRMTVTAEVRESLSALKDVRAFFLERDYAVEMERLERFLKVCREFQALKADGTIDAIAELALRLAVRQ